MIILCISFIAYLFLALVAFIILLVTGIAQEVAVQVFPAFAVLVPLISTTLKDYNITKKVRAGQKPIVGINDFGIHPILISFYAIMILISITPLMVFMGEQQDVNNEASPSSSMYLGIIVILAGYITVRWIGRRCRGKWQISLVAASPIIVLFLVLAIRRIYLIDEIGHQQLGICFLCGYILGALIVSSIPFIALWQGRRQRVNAYISYLLRCMEPGTQQLFLEMMGDEISSMRNRKIIAGKN